MAGKVEVHKDSSSKYRWQLKAGNGEVVATGEAYESKDGAVRGTEAVPGAAAGATVTDLT